MFEVYGGTVATRCFSLSTIESARWTLFFSLQGSATRSAKAAVDAPGYEGNKGAARLAAIGSPLSIMNRRCFLSSVAEQSKRTEAQIYSLHTMEALRLPLLIEWLKTNHICPVCRGAVLSAPVRELALIRSPSTNWLSFESTTGAAIYPTRSAPNPLAPVKQ